MSESKFANIFQNAKATSTEPPQEPQPHEQPAPARSAAAARGEAGANVPTTGPSARETKRSGVEAVFRIAQEGNAARGGEHPAR